MLCYNKARQDFSHILTGFVCMDFRLCSGDEMLNGGIQMENLLFQKFRVNGDALELFDRHPAQHHIAIVLLRNEIFRGKQGAGIRLNKLFPPFRRTTARFLSAPPASYLHHALPTCTARFLSALYTSHPQAKSPILKSRFLPCKRFISTFTNTRFESILIKSINEF